MDARKCFSISQQQEKERKVIHIKFISKLKVNLQKICLSYEHLTTVPPVYLS